MESKSWKTSDSRVVKINLVETSEKNEWEEKLTTAAMRQF